MTRLSPSRLALPLAFALTALTGACSSDDDPADATLTVINDSDFVIEELFVTDVDASGWGPNLLAGDILLPGEEALLFDIPCGLYDALLVDEFGDQCELLSVELCFNDATWVIDNNTCDIAARQQE
jgi:hypothetical protein